MLDHALHHLGGLCCACCLAAQGQGQTAGDDVGVQRFVALEIDEVIQLRPGLHPIDHGGGGARLCEFGIQEPLGKVRHPQGRKKPAT